MNAVIIWVIDINCNRFSLRGKKEPFAMNKNIFVVMMVSILLLSGCYTHQHTMGGGPHSGVTEEHVQWFALWGIIPIGGEVDGGQIAGTTNCRVTTEFGVIDSLISTPLLHIFGRRTIIIEK